MRAIPDANFAFPPYHVESFDGFGLGWHAIMNRQGFNCTTFPEQRGTKFFVGEAGLKEAEATCKRWNEEHV